MRILETYGYTSEVSKFFVLENEKICLWYYDKINRLDLGNAISFIHREGSRTPICK